MRGEGCYESERMIEQPFIINEGGKLRNSQESDEEGGDAVTEGCAQTSNVLLLIHHQLPTAAISVLKNTRTSRHTSIRASATDRYIQTRTSIMPVGRSFEYKYVLS